MPSKVTLPLAALAAAAFSVSAWGSPVRCSPGSCPQAPAVQFQVGPQVSRYEAPVHLGAHLPQLGTGARYVVWATIESPATIVVYSPKGWVPLDYCGSTVPDIVSRCSHPEGASLPMLQGEFTNKELGLSHGVVLEYARTEANNVSHQGYLFQCTNFAGLGFCLPL